MRISRPSQKKPGTLRFAGAILLFFVFFLPLHFHSADEDPTEECSCIHGTRTQMGLARVQAAPPPALQSEFLIIDEPRLYARRGITRRTIRGPPSASCLQDFFSV